MAWRIAPGLSRVQPGVQAPRNFGYHARGPVAQRQSRRLLISRSWVQVPPGSPTRPSSCPPDDDALFRADRHRCRRRSPAGLSQLDVEIGLGVSRLPAIRFLTASGASARSGTRITTPGNSVMGYLQTHPIPAPDRVQQRTFRRASGLPGSTSSIIVVPPSSVAPSLRPQPSPRTREDRSMTERANGSNDPGADAAGARAADVETAAATPLEVGSGGHIRVGTASWTDPTMTAAGVFYPTRRRHGRGAAPVLRRDASRSSRSTRPTTRCRRAARPSCGSSGRRPTSSSTSRRTRC